MAIEATIAFKGFGSDVYGDIKTLENNLIEISNLVRGNAGLDSKVNDEIYNLRTLQFLVQKLNNQVDGSPFAQDSLIRVGAKVKVIYETVEKFNLMSSKRQGTLKTFLRGILKDLGKEITPIRRHLELIGVILARNEALKKMADELQEEHDEARQPVIEKVEQSEDRETPKSPENHAETHRTIEEYQDEVVEQTLRGRQLASPIFRFTVAQLYPELVDSCW